MWHLNTIRVFITTRHWIQIQLSGLKSQCGLQISTEILKNYAYYFKILEGTKLSIDM
jgi:hypothetical protein